MQLKREAVSGEENLKEICGKIIESEDPCDYCTGSLDKKRCESCDRLSMDCFIGRKLSAV